MRDLVSVRAALRGVCAAAASPESQISPLFPAGLASPHLQLWGCASSVNNSPSFPRLLPGDPGLCLDRQMAGAELWAPHSLSSRSPRVWMLQLQTFFWREKKKGLFPLLSLLSAPLPARRSLDFFQLTLGNGLFSSFHNLPIA